MSAGDTYRKLDEWKNRTGQKWPEWFEPESGAGEGGQENFQVAGPVKVPRNFVERREGSGNGDATLTVKPRVSLEGPVWKSDKKPAQVVNTNAPPPSRKEVKASLGIAKSFGRDSYNEKPEMIFPQPATTMATPPGQAALQKVVEPIKPTLWGVAYSGDPQIDDPKKQEPEPTDDEILRGYMGRDRPTERSTDAEIQAYRERALGFLNGAKENNRRFAQPSKKFQDLALREQRIFQEAVDRPVLDSEGRKWRDVSEIEKEARYKDIPKWATETQIYYKNQRLQQKGYKDIELLPRSDDAGDMIIRTIRRVNAETGSPLAQWYYERKGDHQTAENIREDIKMSRERDRLSMLAQKAFWDGGALTGNWWAENSADALARGVSKIGPLRSGIAAPIEAVRAYQNGYNEEIEKLEKDDNFPKRADKERVARERAKRKLAVNMVAQLLSKDLLPDSYKESAPASIGEHADQYREEAVRGSVRATLEGGMHDLVQRIFELGNNDPYDIVQYGRERAEDAFDGGRDAIIDKLLTEEGPGKGRKR